MISKYSNYEYMVYEDKPNNWSYKIYAPNYKKCEQTVICKSSEWFESKSEALFAVVGQISLLEKGIN